MQLVPYLALSLKILITLSVFSVILTIIRQKFFSTPEFVGSSYINEKNTNITISTVTEQTQQQKEIKKVVDKDKSYDKEIVHESHKIADSKKHENRTQVMQQRRKAQRLVVLNKI